MACAVNFCKNRSDGKSRAKGLRFFIFPKDPEQSQLWLKAARRWDLLEKGMKSHRKICSQHFITGKYSKDPKHPDYVPSIFPFNQQRTYRRRPRVQRILFPVKLAPVARNASNPLQQSQKPGDQQSLKPGQQRGPQQVQQQVQSSAQLPPEHKNEQQPKDLVIHLPGYMKGRLPGELFVRLPKQPQQVHPQKQMQDQPEEILDEEASRKFVVLLINQPDGSTERVVRREWYEDHTYSKDPQSPPSPLVEPEFFKTKTSEWDETKQNQEPDQVTQTKETSQIEISITEETVTSEAVQNPEVSQNEPKIGRDSKENQKPLQCPVCRQYSDSVLSFVAHVQKHADDLLTCQVCDKKFPQMNLLNTHIQIHSTEKQFKCEYCDKSYRFKKSLETHVRQHLAGFDCTYCDRSFRTEDALEKHLLWHERTWAREEEKSKLESQRCNCSFCDKTFRNPSVLQEHIEAKHTEKSTECPKCGKIFSSVQKLKEHARIHARNRQTPYSCSVCLQTFETLEKAEAHLEIHRQERDAGKLSDQRVDITVKYVGAEFLCSECGKTFYDKHDLDRHTGTVHSEERPFHCSVCDAKFKYKTSYKCHLMIHTGEKPHSCSVCQKSFRLKKAMDSHMLVHTGHKPFACSTCGKRFRTKASLKHHVRPKEPFSGNRCSKTCKSLKHLKRHMRATHKTGDVHCSDMNQNRHVRKQIKAHNEDKTRRSSQRD